MAYRDGKYYWVKEYRGARWAIGQYRENRSIDGPLRQRFDLCNDAWPILIERIYKIGPPVNDKPPLEEE